MRSAAVQCGTGFAAPIVSIGRSRAFFFGGSGRTSIAVGTCALFAAHAEAKLTAILGRTKLGNWAPALLKSSRKRRPSANYSVSVEVVDAHVVGPSLRLIARQPVRFRRSMFARLLSPIPRSPPRVCYIHRSVVPFVVVQPA